MIEPVIEPVIRTARRGLVSVACLAALALVLPACGVGGVLALSGGGGGGGGGAQRAPNPPQVTVAIPPADPASNFVTLPIVLRDPQIKRVDGEREGGTDDPRVRITAEFLAEGSTTWRPMTDARIVGSDGFRGLSLGSHEFVWNTVVDLPAFVGDVQVRVRAEYEPTAGFKRKFKTRDIRFRVDNRLAATVFGGDVLPVADVDTFPVDLRPDGDALIVASAGAGIVERVDALGRVRRVVGIGIPGDSGNGGDPGVARLAEVAGVEIDRVNGFVFTNNTTKIRITNTTNMTQRIVGADLPPRSIFTLLTATDSSLRGPRLHTTGALLYISGFAGIVALNPRDPAGPGDQSITIAGTQIPAGQAAQIAGGGAQDADGTLAVQALLSAVVAMSVGPDGEIYYVEQSAGRVRVINTGATPLALPVGTVAPGAVMTVAGTGTIGDAGDGGSALLAQFERIQSLDCAPDRRLFIADTFNQRVRLVNLSVAATTFAGTDIASGDVDTVAGGGTGGVGSPARGLFLGVPNAVAVGVSNTILIADVRSVLMINGSSATVTAYGKTALPSRTAQVYDAARRNGLPLAAPTAVHARSPDEVFFADRSAVRVLNLRSEPDVYGAASVDAGGVSTIAGGAVPGFSGDGRAGTSAAFSAPAAIASDGPFLLYVADTGNDRIRVINVGDPNTTAAQPAFGVTVAAGFVDSVVGGGLPGLLDDGDLLGPLAANLNAPQGVATFGGLLFVSDTGHHRVRCVNPGPGDVTVAGTLVPAGTIRTIYGGGVPGLSPDGPGPWLTNTPTAIAIDSRGVLYVSETGNARIRVVNLGLTAAALAGVTLSSVDVPANEMRTLIGSGVRGNFGDGGGGLDAEIDAPADLLVQAADDGTPVALYFSDLPQNVIRVLNLTDEDLIGAIDASRRPSVTIPGGGIISIAGGPNAIGAPNAPAFSGDGEEAARVRFNSPHGIAVVTSNGLPAHFFVADRDNNRLRRFMAPPLIAPTGN